jgi:1,4-dihydroxy-2-naphthoate octaprenyltransferase
VSRVQAWLLAARPPTLWAAVAPVLVGGGLAADDGVFRWDVFVVTMAASVLINVGVNFANDASDARRGVDNAERIGPTRAVASGLIPARTMWGGVAAAFALASACGIYLTTVAGWPILAIGVASLLAALGYTGGPFPYGYRGLGEVFVFLFFGLVATVGSRFAHDATAPLDAWLLAIPVGMLVTAILVANNVRDIDTDRTMGKRTLAVMLGRPATRHLYAVLVLGGFPCDCGGRRPPGDPSGADGLPGDGRAAPHRGPQRHRPTPRSGRSPAHPGSSALDEVGHHQDVPIVLGHLAVAEPQVEVDGRIPL